MGRWLGWWILFGACGSPPAAPPEPIREPVPAPDVEAADEPATVLWIGGDVLLSEAIRDYAQLSDDPAQGMASILAPMAARWQRDEGAFVLVNLETPVANRRRYALNAEPTNPHGYTAVHLHGPRWLLPALAQTGIDAVSLANNHALDQDREGLGETIRNAKEAGLLVTGAGVYPRERWPLVLGDERTMAVVALYDGRGRGYVEDGDPALSFLDDDSFTLVEALDAEHDAVVVTVHVLGELVDEPEDEWRAWAERFVNAGADAIIIHGTHVVMPVERIRGVPIAWGLGNLVSDMGRLANPTRRDHRPLPKAQSPAVRETIMARLSLSEDGLDVRFVAGWMNDDRYPRWHGVMPEGEIELALLPLSGCEPAVELPWPEPYRGEAEAWITQRRDHILRMTGLAMAACDSHRDRASTPWLTPRW